jgi:hypothetical protein
MVSVADYHFKQQAVIKFLVHENKRVVNIHKRLCAVHGSCAIDRSTVGQWVKRVKASEVQKPSSVICGVLVVLSQPTLQTC